MGGALPHDNRTATLSQPPKHTRRRFAGAHLALSIRLRSAPPPVAAEGVPSPTSEIGVTVAHRTRKASILKAEAVHMSGVVVFWVGIVGLLVLIGLAGLIYDRLHQRERSFGDDDQRRADQNMRYYRDVGDSTNSGGW